MGGGAPEPGWPEPASPLSRGRAAGEAGPRWCRGAALRPQPHTHSAAGRKAPSVKSCPRLPAELRCLGQNKSLPDREEPRRVYPSSSAAAALVAESCSLFPAEIPKHLPVSRLLAARNPTRCRDCRGKAARYWSGRRRAGKYLCKAHRAQRLAHAVSAGGGEGKEGLAFSRIKSQKSIRCLFLAKLKRFLSSRECGDLLPD